MEKIIVKLGIILLLVMLASVGVDALYRHAFAIPYQFPQNVLPFPAISDKYEFVLTGNSHAIEGVTLGRFKLKSLNLTDPAEPFEYGLAYLKMYANQIKEGAVIVIDVSQISFSQSTPGKDDAFQTVYYDGRLSPFLIPKLKVEDYVQSQIFPFLRAGFLWREKINTQIKDRITMEERKITPTPSPATAQITGGEETAHPADFFNVNTIEQELLHNSADTPKRLEGSMNFIYDKWYRSGGFGTQYFDANRKDLENLIAYCIRMKWRPVLITIPISKALQAGLLPDYMQVYVYDNVKKTNLRGTEYFDFTTITQLTGDSFLYRDSDHLNPQGAAVFSYLLLQKLIERGYLPKSANGYSYE